MGSNLVGGIIDVAGGALGGGVPSALLQIDNNELIAVLMEAQALPR